MFSLSYLWHGVFLNDFDRLSYPQTIFLIVTSFVYLVIGFVINKVHEIKLSDKFHRKPLLKGIVIGGVCGLVIYLISIVVGVSFTGNLTIEHLLFDLNWQIIEQAMGGLSIALVHRHLIVEEDVFNID